MSVASISSESPSSSSSKDCTACIKIIELNAATSRTRCVSARAILPLTKSLQSPTSGSNVEKSAPASSGIKSVRSSTVSSTASRMSSPASRAAATACSREALTMFVTAACTSRKGGNVSATGNLFSIEILLIVFTRSTMSLNFSSTLHRISQIVFVNVCARSFCACCCCFIASVAFFSAVARILFAISVLCEHSGPV